MAEINCIQVENFSKSYGEKVLFENITFSFNIGDKVALIAPNGSGKTSLLNIIMGNDIADSGSLSTKKDLSISFLKQQPDLHPDNTVMDEILNENNNISKIIKNYEHCLHLHSINPTDANAKLLEKAIEEVDINEAWDYEVKVKEVLYRLNIKEIEQKIGTLSGGQLKRVALAKVLLENSELLILDEPTNHLDVEMIEWLEDFLSKERITLFIVTHDRYFLDNVCSMILEIDNGKMYAYQGNYSYFLEKKAERIFNQEREQDKLKNLYKKELDWMRRQPQARTTKSKARIDSFYGIEDRLIRNKQQGINEIEVKASRLGGKIIEAKYISKGYDGKNFVNDFDYVFRRYEKVGLVGPNGSGKTTLLNMLTGNLKPDKGFVDIGDTIQFGYYTQQLPEIPDDDKVIDVVKKIAEVVTLGDGKVVTVAQFLSTFGFEYPAQNGYYGKLSGGEKRRLHLLCILIRNPNFLILDEPTNDLDIFTLQKLEEFLIDFKGCLLVVTHDRYFMDQLAEHIFVFEDNGTIRDFPGNYSEYLQNKIERQKLQKKAEEKKDNTNNVAKSINQSPKKKRSYKEQKEYESLELEIEQLENEKKEVIEKMNSGVIKPDEITKLSSRFATLGNLIDEKTYRWMELGEIES